VTSGSETCRGCESPGDGGGVTAVSGSERKRDEPDHGIKNI